MINITNVNVQPTYVDVTGTLLNDQTWRDYLASSLEGLFGALGCRINNNGLSGEVNMTLPTINNQVVNFTIRLNK